MNSFVLTLSYAIPKCVKLDSYETRCKLTLTKSTYSLPLLLSFWAVLDSNQQAKGHNTLSGWLVDRLNPTQASNFH